jgi:ABC-type transport system involved in multi-copper enzyme maturation permease subunit
MSGLSLRNEICSELLRSRRRAVLFGWLGLSAVLAALVNTVMFQAAVDAQGQPTAAPGVDFPSVQVLETVEGLTAGVASASSMLGVVTLAFWALLTATDYSTGFVRLLVAAQPRRWPLLVGKAVALTLWTACAALLALVVNVGVAPAGASSAGVDTSAWDAVAAGDLLAACARLFSALLVWGLLGLALATVTRSAAVAISIGVGYVLLLEGVLASVLGGVADVLPGSVLTALARGGTDAVSQGQALVLGGTYAAVALVVALVVLQRRDVTD